MGLLDGGFSSLLGGYPGPLQNFGMALMANSGPSRMPHGFLSDVGQAGLLSGQDQRQQMLSALQGQNLSEEALGRRISNLSAARDYNMMAPFYGQSPINITGQSLQGPQQQLSAPQSQAAPQINNAASMSSTLFPNQGNQSALSATPNMLDMLSSIPPPILQKMGFQVPPEINAAFYAGIKPGTPEYATMVRNVAIKASGVAPTIGGERPGVPAQNYDLSTGTYQPQPGTLQTMFQGAQTQAAGAGAGGLPAKEAESAFNAGLKVRTENEIERRKAFYQTGIEPPDAGNPTMAPEISPTGDIATSKGTVVPAPPKMTTFPGTDALLKQNANSAETEKNFGAIRGTLEGTEARMIGLAKALQTVQSGGLNEKRAEIANTMRGLHLDKVADVVQSGKDTAAVQTAMGLQTLDVLGQLKQINQGTGGRILNAEFQNLVDKQYGPDLSPQANYDLLTQALGGVYQTKNMIDDYYKIGKPRGWPDANAYQSAYYSNPANSYQKMVEIAGKTMGPLKGMEGGPGSPPTIDANAARAELIRRGVIKQ